MNLHANAALSLNKRRLLAKRVVEEKWTLSEAAAAAEVSVRTAQKWSARYREEGESGLLDRPSAAKRIHNRTCEQRIAGDRRAQASALHRHRDRRTARDGRDHCVGHPDADRDGPARPTWARAGRAL